MARAGRPKAVLRRTAPWCLALTLLLSAAACDDGHGSAASTGPGSSAVAPTGPSTVGVVFRKPLTMPQVTSLAARHQATIMALWRTDTICVEEESLAARGARRHSAFAYWEADDIVARREASKGPPITDGGTTFRMWARWKQEWESANVGGRTFQGAALFLPAGGDVDDKAVARSEPVESYRIEEDDVRYLRGHDKALAPLFPETPSGPC